MNELPLSSPYRTHPTSPVSDGEREGLAARLASEFTAGRISQDDYFQKLDLVYGADTLGDLVPVVAGLPPVQTHGVPAIVEQGKKEQSSLAKLAESKSIVPISMVLTSVITASVLLTVVLAFVFLL